MSGDYAAIAEWWHQQMGDRDKPEARALSARIRRAVSDVDVAAEPKVHELANSHGLGMRAIPLARILSEIREDGGGVLAKRLGPGLKEPVLSQPRFNRLIRSEGDALTMALRRVLPRIDRKCNVAVLARDFLHWNERTRIRWTFDYYNSVAPDALTEEKGEKEILE